MMRLGFNPTPHPSPLRKGRGEGWGLDNLGCTQLMQASLRSFAQDFTPSGRTGWNHVMRMGGTLGCLLPFQGLDGGWTPVPGLRYRSTPACGLPALRACCWAVIMHCCALERRGVVAAQPVTCRSSDHAARRVPTLTIVYFFGAAA